MYEELKEVLCLLLENDDLIDQNSLFKAQTKVLELTIKAATEEHKAKDLYETFPWMFHKAEI